MRLPPSLRWRTRTGAAAACFQCPRPRVECAARSLHRRRRRLAERDGAGIMDLLDRFLRGVSSVCGLC
jgi:hypothetical protein